VAVANSKLQLDPETASSNDDFHDKSIDVSSISGEQLVSD